MKKTIFKLLIITLAIGAFLGILFIILDYWNTITLKIFLTSVIIFGFSIPGLCCSYLYEKEKIKKLSVACMIFCLLSTLYYLLVVWANITFNNTNLKVLLSLAIICASIGHISLLLIIDSINSKIRNLKNATIFLSIILDILLLTEIIFDSSIAWQIYAILIILIALGTIVTPIIYRLNKNDSKINKYTKLSQLKSLLDDKAITIEEYDSEKEKILNE